MPRTHTLNINVDNQSLDIGALEEVGINISYTLEDPENFEQKQSSMSLDITVPATPANDKVFNTFHDFNVEDMTPDQDFSKPRPFNINVGGVEVMRGKALLQSAGRTNVPEDYNFNCYGNNGDWVLDMKDMTLWDCLSVATHTFDLSTVEASWTNFDSDENHDYVYAPVRYRQPFGEFDDRVSVFHLRPSLSIYWMIQRAFRTFGYRVNSTFIDSPFFRRLVLPWVWGSFFDIEGEATKALAFKAAGPNDTINADGGHDFADPKNLSWKIESGEVGDYNTFVFSYLYAGSSYRNFRINNTAPPIGFDNFDVYTFEESTGTLHWIYNPPTYLADFIGNNITATFKFNLIAKSSAGLGRSSRVRVHVTQNHSAGGPATVTILDYDTLDLGAHGTKGSLLTQTPFVFSIGGIDRFDSLDIRLQIESSGSSGTVSSLEIISSQLINTNPGGGIPVWTKIYSTLELTSLSLSLGGTVNFKFYDKFKSYKFLDMFRGLVDMFNWSVQTNPIDKVVTIEPTHEYKMPGTGAMTQGYFLGNRLDWHMKQDVSRKSTLQLFSDYERQLDFSFKGDGSDGGQNIYTARYKGVYLNHNILTAQTDKRELIQAALPGSSRYVFPSRFRKGNRNMVNRFFSPTMHYIHKAWDGISGTFFSPGPAPQLIAIIPENVSDSSASTVAQTFEPKIAYYKGYVNRDNYGGWRYIGNPASPYSEATATSFNLPFMFSVNYGHDGQNDPVLTYGDQYINGQVIRGLMKTFFLKRLATMRNGKQLRSWMRLNLGDVIDWEHRNSIIIETALFHLIGIDRYNPLSDDAAQCTLWKTSEPMQVDVDNCYPSAASLVASGAATVLSQFDLKYAPLLLFNTDLPQI